METDYISREAATQAKPEFLNENHEDAEKALYAKGWNACNSAFIDNLLDIPAADVRPVPPGGIGEMSDGYHTFNGLYYQRMVLFAALVKLNKDSSWKSHRHEDGEVCFGGGWFIVGIDTPEGSYTYHYEDKDWDLFDCEELPVGKHWDGHTEDDVTRLLSLPEMRPVVLCRNCFAYRKDRELARAAYLNPEEYCALLRTEMPEDGFCFYGKRRDGGTP